VLQVAALTVFAVLLARVAGAPRGSWRYVLGAAALALAASQTLPEGNAFRADVAGSARTLFWVGLGLIPVAAYAVLVRRLRRRSGSDAADPPPRPQGLVQFADDDALAADTAAGLAAETGAMQGDPVSLGWRAADGSLAGHLRLRIRGDAAEIEMLWVEPGQRRRGVGSALLHAAEGEAAARGARTSGALVGDWQAPGFFKCAGYSSGEAHCLGAGRSRAWMEKRL